jgi:hypothetical protein
MYFKLVIVNNITADYFYNGIFKKYFTQCEKILTLHRMNFIKTNEFYKFWFNLLS